MLKFGLLKFGLLFVVCACPNARLNDAPPALCSRAGVGQVRAGFLDFCLSRYLVLGMKKSNQVISTDRNRAELSFRFVEEFNFHGIVGYRIV